MEDENCSNEWPVKCPKCESAKITHEERSEYTGGGYADIWTEFFCENCGWTWKNQIKSDYK